MRLPWLKLLGALAVIWLIAGGVIFFARSAKVTPESLVGYVETHGLAGRTPGERVRAVGYKETLVGENIAYGPPSADDVVKGWLDSPGHCENIMDPRFTEMGLAYAPGRAPKPGLYWVQLFAAPRG